VIAEPQSPLLASVARGDANATRACLDRYGGLVWGIARRFFGASAEAEDAVQDAFMDLWRCAGRYDPNVSSEHVFVALIARRRFIDRKRRGARRLDTEPLAPDPPAAPSTVEEVTEANLATRALDQLRPEQRQVLLLATCHGLSHEEISQSTGMPLGTVKAHARRGLIRVRELLSLGEGSKR
jgi:RNA polymerase sigma-70 factor (ECF subfamily)